MQYVKPLLSRLNMISNRAVNVILIVIISHGDITPKPRQSNCQHLWVIWLF